MLESLAGGALENPNHRPRPPEVHHAQRRNIGGRGDERLHESETEQTAPPPAAEAAPAGGAPAGAPAVPLAPDLNVVMKAKGPV